MKRPRGFRRGPVLTKQFGAGRGAPAGKLTYDSTTRTTRRLAARPSRVSFGATGASSP